MRWLRSLPALAQVLLIVVVSLVLVAAGQGAYALLAGEPFHIRDFAVLAAIGGAYGLFLLWRDRRSAAAADEANHRESEETK
jgi:hypothetical protein